MADNELNRLSRLSAILTLLQSKRLLTSTAIAKKFGISIRTVYRDIRALEQSGVPILTEEGKGYSLMEGFSLPPVMFTKEEANALLTASLLVAKNTDLSFIRHHGTAITKIQAVLNFHTREKTDLLRERMQVRENNPAQATSNNLSAIQLAIADFSIIKVDYLSLSKQEVTSRLLAPLALYTTQGSWVLVAWCYLREAYRAFRLDKISAMQVTDRYHAIHDFNLQQFFEECRKKSLLPLT